MLILSGETMKLIDEYFRRTLNDFHDAALSEAEATADLLHVAALVARGNEKAVADYVSRQMGTPLVVVRSSAE